MSKVIVGMSGGVDSAVTAYLLKKAGYEVIGVTLRTWAAENGEESRCCEIDDARGVARTLGIPFYAVNCLSQFEKKVVAPFVEAYAGGFTPNPCIECNHYVKWERLLHMAKVLGADYVATGHYASVVHLSNGRYSVRKARYAAKDQTYMLYKLSQEQLAATLMPLGDFSKDQVRRIAQEADLAVAHKADSQEICFVSEGDYTDFIREHAVGKLPGEGYFVDETGKIIGKHQGIIHYTVGQRKGLGLALGYPAYVTRIRARENEVVIGRAPDLMKTQVLCSDIHFMSIASMMPGQELKASVKIRYQHPGQEAILHMTGEDRMSIRFQQPVRAATPGQAAVFYDEQGLVIGGGRIETVT